MESVSTHVFQSNKIAIGKLPLGEKTLPATHGTDILRGPWSAVNATDTPTGSSFASHNPVSG